MHVPVRVIVIVKYNKNEKDDAAWFRVILLFKRRKLYK